MKWKKKNTSDCSICHAHENIAHLIYNCPYAQQIWTTFTNAFGIYVTLGDVIFGQYISCEMNVMISIIVYLLYKEWLELSYDGNRHANVSWKRYHGELKWYLKIYSEMESLKMHVPNIKKIMDAIRM